MNKDEKVVICGLLAFVLSTFIIIIAMGCQAQKYKRDREKDKFIEVERNSLGCIKYRYNSDIVWKCPKEQGVTQIERRVCSYNAGTKTNSDCKTVYDPVIN